MGNTQNNWIMLFTNLHICVKTAHFFSAYSELNRNIEDEFTELIRYQYDPVAQKLTEILIFINVHIDL